MTNYFKKAVALLLTLILMLSLFTSCSNKKNSLQNNTTNVTTTYPYKIVDSYGREVTIDKKPERIISLSPNITEIVTALNATERLVGRTDYCDYPETIKSVASVGSITEPSIEKIVELKPDIVIASSLLKKEIVDKIAALNVKIVMISEKESFDGVYTTIQKIGEIIDENNAAKNLIEGMKTKVSEVTEKVKNADKPKVYYVVGYGQYGDYTATRDTFISQLIEMAGATNIATDAEGWKYSLEKIVEHDPDILICSKYFDTKKGIEQSNGYKDLRAVKEGKLLEIDNNMLDRQGPRLAQGLEELAKLIHPELFK
ncbi:ABC transporter substrate-binding protein [Fervidicella metallireducens AeB]|uniref:ABC transporter substrate-binding protein n=1 Tax=Fervidicella metallireducens AeB TaxID=1403537 RepID=A0A017RUZ3_9CLOT|nr:ABC transporter substrate-binding protein [Fervidicella metallireducens]EYE88553.1 ABC transporter substrate-binding protein [Fervidicella metallireducens AeB]